MDTNISAQAKKNAILNNRSKTILGENPNLQFETSNPPINVSKE